MNEIYLLFKFSFISQTLSEELRGTWYLNWCLFQYMIHISWLLEIFEPIDDQKKRLEFCFSIPQAVKLFYFPLFSILYQKFLSHIMISETFIYQKLSFFLYSKRNKNQLQTQQFRNWTKSFYCPPKTLSNPLTIATRFDIVFHSLALGCYNNISDKSFNL